MDYDRLSINEIIQANDSRRKEFLYERNQMMNIFLDSFELIDLII
jgi:hypothetical protein